MLNVEANMGPIRVRVVVFALTIALGSVAASWATNGAVQDQKASGTVQSKRMLDGKQWTTENLNVKTVSSYCYEDNELTCRQYGRLYTWESAQRGCQLLGEGWRLPTNEEWRRMAKLYGGVRGDSDDDGKAAFKALLSGGSSGLNALLGGRRDNDGQYARLNAHGFYWTASESDPVSAWFYNFGQGLSLLNRHSDGEKHRALSVRCVRNGN